MNETWSDVRADGRRLEVLSLGVPDGPTVLFHGGTPTAAVPFPPAREFAQRHGARVITYSRPGYGASDPRPGRTVADAVPDVAAILDAASVAEFVAVGWSGGGPHALACGALLPGRCRAVATIAGVAPHEADGLDWLAGMGAENVEEFGAAATGDPALTDFLTRAAAQLREVTAQDVAAALGDLVPPVDVETLHGPYADWAAASFRKAVDAGIDGWRDDDLAFIRPWGFELSDIRCPVAVWQGDQDRMVPFAHGRWLAAHVPPARPHLLPGDGHLSLAVESFDAILSDLLATAGW
jgi:pimeloyl-ACP methyl ester carboxylesterase